MIFPLRNTEEDFFLWCHRYTHQALFNIESFRKGRLDVHRERELYDDSLRIKRQLYAIESLLPPRHLEYFRTTLLVGETPTNDPVKRELYREIYVTWQAVCFPNGKSHIKTIDPVLLGGELRRLRLRRGFTAKRVSELTDVAEKTLFSYEEGKVLPKLDIFCKLCHLYNILMMEVVQVSEILAPVRKPRGTA